MPPRRRRQTGVATSRMSPAERRVQLLVAAREVIRSDGLGTMTMERVAAEAGVSKPVLYSHFENRAALLIALLEDFWESIDSRLATVSTEVFTTQLVDSYFDALALGGPALQALLASGSHEPEVDRARRIRFRNIERIWSRQYQSALGLEPAVADAAAAVVRSAMAGAGDYWMSSGERSREVSVAVCMSVVRGALVELKRTASAPD